MAVMSFVYASTRGRCRLSEGYTCPPQSTLARHSAIPLDAARPSEQQHWQYHQRGGDERDHERAEEAHSAVDAAKTGENAEHDIYGDFHHGGRSRRSAAVALSPVEPLLDWRASARVNHEPANHELGCDVCASALERLVRESHISFCALMNSL